MFVVLQLVGEGYVSNLPDATVVRELRSITDKLMDKFHVSQVEKLTAGRHSVILVQMTLSLHHVSTGKISFYAG